MTIQFHAYGNVTASSVSGIDAKTTGSTLLWTPDSDFLPIRLTIHCTAGTLVTILPTLSLGTNGSSYNNLMSSTLLTIGGSAGSYRNFSLTGVDLTKVAAGTGIYLKVAIGAIATSMTIKATLTGDYA